MVPLREQDARAQSDSGRPETAGLRRALSKEGMGASLVIVALFWCGTVAIAGLRDRMVRHRPGQFVHQDILSRADFVYTDPEIVVKLRQDAREAAPSVYRKEDNSFASLERRLMGLPAEVASRTTEQLPADLAQQLDSGTITKLKDFHIDGLDIYHQSVRQYLEQLRRAVAQGTLVVLSGEERDADLSVSRRLTAKVEKAESEYVRMDVARTFSDRPVDVQRAELLRLIHSMADRSFESPLPANIAGFTVATLTPTHVRDAELTAAERNEAERNVSTETATHRYPRKSTLVSRGNIISQAQWKLLDGEQKAFVASLSSWQRLLSHAGMAGIAAVIAAALSAYVGMYQPRIVRNHARAVGIAGLLLSMLLVAQLAGVGTGPILVFGVAPTILAAMILAIAYDRRFALGVGTLLGMLTTAALDQGIGFFVVIWTGAATCSLLLDEVRTRSKLVEVGGITAMTMIAAAAAVGAMALDPLMVIWQNSMHAAAAGLGAGFIVLGVLPFIEKAFRITTSMTLLELADASQPLLRRLSIEAPGTYNHSLQVASLSEAAAEAIGANSLLCRVGSYYHDIGKMNKADYFCENQTEGQNRHLNLSPQVSLQIIIGHVKDGMELAREYNLPTALRSFIQQHHGTTLVEYFYHQACTQRTTQEAISDAEFRYPGPKPRSRETAVVMVADAVESASRTMSEPTAERIEKLVHEIVMRRMLDGQFDESDITFKDLMIAQKALIRTLHGIYHVRMAYPSTASITRGTTATTVKSA